MIVSGLRSAKFCFLFVWLYEIQMNGAIGILHAKRHHRVWRSAGERYHSPPAQGSSVFGSGRLQFLPGNGSRYLGNARRFHKARKRRIVTSAWPENLRLTRTLRRPVARQASRSPNDEERKIRLSADRKSTRL